MPDRIPLRRLLASAGLAGLTGLVASAGGAQAEPFAIHSALRHFCCTDWTDRTATPSPAPNPGGGALFLVGGVVTQPATVGRTLHQTLTTPPFALTIPPSRFGAHYSFSGLPHPHPLFDQLSIALSIENAAGVLYAGGGPGAFDFCPTNSSVPSSLACHFSPPWTPGALSFAQGRIAVTPGPNQFGGAMGWLGSGLTGVIYGRNTPGPAATRFTAHRLAEPFSMIGTNAALSNPIPTPEAFLAFAPYQVRKTYYSTSMHWLDPSAVPLSSDVWTGRATGHLWTTGMLTVTVSQAALPPFIAVTLTGSDARATTGPEIGSGELTLVSGVLVQDGSGVTAIRGTSIHMRLPEPGAAIMVATGALALLRSGARRRRPVGSDPFRQHQRHLSHQR